MHPRNHDFLPVLAADLPEAFRIDLALNDLHMIAQTAQARVALHEYATATASEIIHDQTATDTPNQDRLKKIAECYGYIEAGDKITAGSAAWRMVSPDEPALNGVTEKDVTKDVLSELHPDRIGRDTFSASRDEEAFKTITEARQNKDRILEQGLYAGSAASRAAGAEHLSAATLELARYKAWLALGASQGRFETVEEVDAWQAREQQLLPARARAALLITVNNCFLESLGLTADGRLPMPTEFFGPISENLQNVGKVIKKLKDADLSTNSVAILDLPDFDQRLSHLLDEFDNLRSAQAVSGQHPTYLQSELAFTFSENFAEVARILNPKNPILEIGRLVARVAGIAIAKSDTTADDRGHEEDKAIMSSAMKNRSEEIIKNMINKNFSREYNYFKKNY